MHRSVSHTTRALAATLAITVATSPALAAVHVVTVQADGTFLPKYLTIAKGDTVEWRRLGRTDAVARLSTTGLTSGGAPYAASIDTTAVCSDYHPDDPLYVSHSPTNPYRQPYEGTNVNEPTGPGRRGVSGIWALGPEGGEVSKLELPSAEADVIHAGLLGSDSCTLLTDLTHGHDVAIADDPTTPLLVEAWMTYSYADNMISSGDTVATPVPNPVTDPAGVQHRLCVAFAAACDATYTHCVAVEPDPAKPATLPPGTYLNGLMTSTYDNPDVTGVVLRFNWKDLQYDNGGVVTERWQHLDRELDRAIAHGKLVTFDVRAGMFGTPDWIFSDYLRNDPVSQDDTHAASWCAAPGPCAFAPGAAPPDAGQVQDLTFLDHYEETPPGDGCGSPVRIGAPGDVHYRALYKEFISRLAAHVATDSRWWQAVAHVKVSGANLRTSEAELPHHCDDDYTNTGDHQVDPKVPWLNPTGDRVLDVFKTLDGTLHKTVACVCNPKVWFDTGYVPQSLYDYYAEVEQQIVASFFGEKSLGYQLIQAGFPRANADGGTGSFDGDDLYQEALVDATAPPTSIPFRCGNGVINAGEACDDGNLDETDGCRSDCTPTYLTNTGFDALDVCAIPSVDATTLLPEVFENRPVGAEEYCSSDTSSNPAAAHVFLSLDPLARDLAYPDIAAYPDSTNSATRYPGSSAQAEEVLDEAGNGRFASGTTPPAVGYADRVAGKLFVPQHSGIQPFPQERFVLGYAGTSTPSGCAQQLLKLPAPAALVATVGAWVAGFPMAPTAISTGLNDPLRAGCPNEWIVDQGKDRDLQSAPPAGAIPILYPPQLTGFQTTNKVRSIAHVESTLFNLVYNSNAVFIELYEDAIWQIGRTRGTGPGAVALDDPGAPVRLATVYAAYTACDPAVSCYSKNLSQWAEELHLRRAKAASLWATYRGTTYPGLQHPFPTTYRQTFTNTTGVLQQYPYINPSRCLPGLVNFPVGAGPSALGLIRVRP